MLKKSLWSLLDVFLNRGVSIIFVVILGNLISPSNLGIYVALLIFISYGVSLFSFNLEAGVVQKLNDHKLESERNNYFSAGLLSLLLIGLLFVALSYAFINPIASSLKLSTDRFFLELVVPLVFFDLLNQYLKRLLSSDLRFKELALINLLSISGLVLISLILIYLGFGLTGIVAGLYFSRLLEALTLILKLKGRFNIVTGEKTWLAFKDLFRFSILIYLGTIAVFLDQNIDLLMVNIYLEKEDLALYNYALKIAILFIMFGNGISAVTFPKMTKAFSKHGALKLNLIYRISQNFSFLILGTLSLIMAFNVSFVLDLILPEFYSGISELLVILLSGILIFSVFSTVGTIFTSVGLPAYGAVVNWIAMLLNLFLNVLLIPKMGLSGAAIATTTSFTLRSIIGMILVERKIKTNYNYLKLIMAYGIFLVVLFGGHFLITSIVLKEILIIAFFIISFMLLMGKFERKLLKLNF